MITALIDYLAIFYQAGDMVQLEIVARSMLAAIPDDLVALQFLGLALYQMGRIKEAYRAFEKAATRSVEQEQNANHNNCEPAHVASLRFATLSNSGLSAGWNRIAFLLNDFGFHKQAKIALEAEVASQNSTALKIATSES